MQNEIPVSGLGRPISPGLPIAAFLLIGAGVAIAQPLENRKSTPPARTDRSAPVLSAATIRIVLPPPADLAPPAKRVSAGSVRISLDKLAPVSLAPAMVTPPSSPAPPLVDGGADPQAENKADLAAPKGKDTAGFSATLREISASLGSAPARRMDAFSDAASGDDLAYFGANGPAETRQSSRADQALVGSRPDHDDPLTHSESPQAILTEVMKPKPKRRSITSVALQVSATVNGNAAGPVSLLINDAENIAVRLSDLLAILQPAIEPALYERLSESQAAQAYMTLNELRLSGISARFDDDDRLVLDTPRGRSSQPENAKAAA